MNKQIIRFILRHKRVLKIAKYKIAEKNEEILG